MSNVLATATTWAVVSLVSATITVKLIDVSVAQFSSIASHMAEATGERKVPEARRPVSFDTLFRDFDWSPRGGVAEAAVELSQRFTLLVTQPAE